MKDAVLKSGPHPTLATQSHYRDVTSCDRDGAPTAFDIASRDSLHGPTTIRDPGSKGHPEPAMEDAVLKTWPAPNIGHAIASPRRHVM